MTTATSYSNPKRCLNFYGGLLKRGRGLMFLVFILEFIFSTVQYWIYLANVVPSEYRDYRIIHFAGQSQMHTGVMAVCFTGILLAAPLVVGLIQMAYMHSKKAADVYHSLPLSRPQLLVANLASAFTIVMAPTAVNYLLMGITAAVAGSRGAVFDPLGILCEFACWGVYVLAVLAVVAFVAVQVGTVFDNLIFTGELLAGPAFITLAILGAFSMMLAGFNMDNVDPFVLAALSPFSLMVVRMAVPWGSAAANSIVYSTAPYQPYLVANTATVVWLALAVLLVVAACFLYTRRKTEMAERSTSRGPLALVGKAAFMLLCGPVGSVLLCTILGLQSRAAYLLWTVVLAAVAYVVAEAVLLRGFRGFKRGLVSGCALLALTTAFGLAAMTGGLGYESRVPALEKVESVTVSYRGRYDLSQLDASTKRVNEMSEEERRQAMADGDYHPYSYFCVRDVTLTQPESVAAVQEIQQMILREQGSGRDSWNVESSTQWNRYGYNTFQVSYRLANGKIVRRYYYGIPSDACQAMAKLENLEEFKLKTHAIFTAEADDFASVTVLGMNGETVITDRTQIARLIDALAADYREETVDGILENGQSDRAFVSFAYRENLSAMDLAEDTYTQCDLVITSQWNRTLQVLEEAGAGEVVRRDTGKAAQAVVISDGRYYSDGPIQIAAGQVPRGEDVQEYLWQHYGYDEGMDLAESNPYVYRTSDPSLIARLAAEANIQYAGQRYHSQLVLADENGRILSSWAIPYGRLPQEVYNALDEEIRKDYECSMGLLVDGEGEPAGNLPAAAEAVDEATMPVAVSSPEDTIQVSA